MIHFFQLIQQLLPFSFRIGLVMMLITQYLISHDLLKSNRSILEMTVLDLCNHSKSMDWIDWKLSKSAEIHLPSQSAVNDMINRNHSTFWIVNHWNRFKLVKEVSVIMAETLNWRIYHNYNLFKLVPLEIRHIISVIVRLWLEVLLDMKNI